MSAALLQVQSLRKVFPGKPPVVAVDDISFSLGAGEILGLLGPNGAGKTTTIQMLLSTLRSTSGSISYFGMDLERHRSEILKYVGYGSAYAALVWRLSVEENLEIYARLACVPWRERAQRVTALLERFDASSFRKKQMSELSAGQRTRVVLCKVFVGYPKIALLDEPTASLDPDVAHEVRAFVKHQRREYGVSMLYTCHNMAEVEEVCDEVLFLTKGKIIARDTPQALASSIAGTRVRFTASGQGEKLLLWIARHAPGAVVKDEESAEVWTEDEQVPALIESLIKEGLQFSRLSVERASLEDFFLQMTKKQPASPGEAGEAP